MKTAEPALALEHVQHKAPALALWQRLHDRHASHTSCRRSKASSGHSTPSTEAEPG